MTHQASLQYQPEKYSLILNSLDVHTEHIGEYCVVRTACLDKLKVEN